MDDREEAVAVAARVEGEADDGGVEGDGEERGGNSGVGDGDEGLEVERSEDEVVGFGIPGEGFWVEVRVLYVDYVAVSGGDGGDNCEEDEGEDVLFDHGDGFLQLGFCCWIIGEDDDQFR